jgi:hypothetical protein
MPCRLPRRVAGLVLVALALGAAAGCGAVTGGKPTGTPGTAAPASASTPMTGCGTTRTAAGVPVEIEIEHGPAPCPAALAVERDYAREVASGKVPGNGGGAPVTIRGWLCKGFTTPQVLATGQTSACRKGSARIVAVLKMSATASPSATATS